MHKVDFTHTARCTKKPRLNAQVAQKNIVDTACCTKSICRYERVAQKAPPQYGRVTPHPPQAVLSLRN